MTEFNLFGEKSLYLSPILDVTDSLFGEKLYLSPILVSSVIPYRIVLYSAW